MDLDRAGADRAQLYVAMPGAGNFLDAGAEEIMPGPTVAHVHAADHGAPDIGIEHALQGAIPTGGEPAMGVPKAGAVFEGVAVQEVVGQSSRLRRAFVDHRALLLAREL